MAALEITKIRSCETHEAGMSLILLPGLSLPHRRCFHLTVLPFPNFFPEPWLTSLRLTTTRPARQRWAAAESRSFERCVPTTSCRDRAPASSIPLRAHGPPAARICTSATAMRTRCGEGDLVGGWHAGASPFTPITRWVTNRGSSSASFAHAYTPLGRAQRL